ncbi:MAG: hypothetical protein M0036_20580 [Desulfobacteraceae bacterium]|nr:hypothetical protein [Desulfobacteraceae bacterium]
MPHVLESELSGPGVIIRFSGQVNGDEIYRLNEQLMADPAFIRWRYQIWDFSEVAQLQATLDQLRLFALQDAAAAKLNPSQKIAIIPRQQPASGLDRTFHTLEKVWGAYESRSFSDLDAAHKWCTQP